MKKRRIVLASILKPVNDTRMMEKIGHSLARDSANQVYIIGYPTGNQNSSSTITVLPLKSFSRISIGRLLAPLQVLRKCVQVKPEILIVNTYELLIVGIAIRILFGTRICYDIRENYASNILKSSTLPVGLRHLVAGLVRVKEWICMHWYHALFLAEKSYENELKFASRKSIVLENKAVVPAGFLRTPTPVNRTLIFTGTLAESTGVFRAIELAKQLHAIDPAFLLTIIGYSPVSATIEKIRAAIGNHNFINLVGGSTLVPHDKIWEAIRTAHAGIVSYPSAPHINPKIPTKLYEYLAAQLPIILTNNPTWTTVCQPYGAAITVDFNKLEPERIINELRTRKFYPTSPQNVHWQSEESRLLEAIRKFYT